MFKNITKIAGLLFVSALLINCPKKKEDDNTALIGLLALSNAGATCEVTASGVSIGAVPLSNAASVLVNIPTRMIGTNTVAVVSAKGVTATQVITVSGAAASSFTLFKQSACPINTAQNLATITTDYTASSSSDITQFTINTPGDYLVFVNATSITASIRAGVSNN